MRNWAQVGYRSTYIPSMSAEGPLCPPTTDMMPKATNGREGPIADESRRAIECLLRAKPNGPESASESPLPLSYFCLPVVCCRSPAALLSPPCDPVPPRVAGNDVSRFCAGRALLGTSPCVFGCGSAGVCGCGCAYDVVASTSAVAVIVALRIMCSSSVHAYNVPRGCLFLLRSPPHSDRPPCKSLRRASQARCLDTPRGRGAPFTGWLKLMTPGGSP